MRPRPSLAWYNHVRSDIPIPFSPHPTARFSLGAVSGTGTSTGPPARRAIHGPILSHHV
jgi:hypothetical protein